MGGALGAGRASKVLQSYLDISSTRDNFLGTIGGGNHFVEMQVVDEIVDRKLAYAHGLKVGSFCIMCHSGSLDLGQTVGIYYKEKAKEQHKGAYPKNGFFALDDVMGLEYIDAAYNAANFATVNRAIMASMLAEVLDTNLSSVYDSPHNLTWLQNNKFLHRKGACSAELDEIVMIPGSMGTRSCLAVGQGFAGTMSSSAHGAGRVLNRNAARTTKVKENIDVITKIDLSRARPDIATEVGKHIAEESPSSYKDIEEVVASSVGAGIIKPIAWMKPVFTIKG
jgi:tRNA-splicing ligase RtcB